MLNEFFYPDEKDGGSGAMTTYFTRGLAEVYGVEVTAIASRYAYRHPNVRYEARSTWEGGEIYRVISPNWGRDRSIRRLVGNFVLTYATAWKAIWLPRADVTLVLTNPVVLPIAACIIKRIRGTPYLYMINDLEPDRVVTLGVQRPDSRMVKTMRRWQRAWVHGAARTIAIGRCMKDRLVEQYDADPDKIAVADNGANPNAVHPQSKQSAFRAKNGIDGFVVMYSGNFGRYHDFDTLFGAAERLGKTHPDVKFVLVGQGYKRDYILSEIPRRNLTNVLVFPFVPESEFSDLLASADLTMVTLEKGMEGVSVPSKFFSFLSSGRPIIALMRPNTEVALVVAENDIGYCMEAGDVDRLVEAILDAKSDPAKLDEMGRRAREAFDKGYTLDHFTEKVYQALLECKRVGR
jgi:glycosyltransferase involved in cell wall biosynthesis